MQQELSEINGKKIKAGVFGGEHAWLASIHEYGCDILVTPEMRAFLHYKGLHLKETTSHIHIPERSFLRSGYDDSKDELLKNIDILMSEILGGKIKMTAACESIGRNLMSNIKVKAQSLDTPSNHPFTIQKKGSKNPLMDTEEMIKSISYKVE